VLQIVMSAPNARPSRREPLTPSSRIHPSRFGPYGEEADAVLLDELAAALDLRLDCRRFLLTSRGRTAVDDGRFLRDLLGRDGSSIERTAVLAHERRAAPN
jgi:hypothetical protein